MKLEREAQGLSLADVSKRTGLDPATVSKIENGRLPNPTWSTLRAYGNALGVRLVVELERVPVDAGQTH